MQYIKVRRSDLEKVSCEFMLMCLDINIRNFFTLLDKKEIKSKYWEKSNTWKQKKGTEWNLSYECVRNSV